MASANIKIFLLISLTTFISGLQIIPSNWREWEEFKTTHKKVYKSHEEEIYRMKIFAENLVEIANHNALFASGDKSYSMKMNQFGDMLREEINVLLKGVQGESVEEILEGGRRFGSAFVKRGAKTGVPSAIDWRSRGAVTDVENQQGCGSCWAFSAIGSIEGQYFLKTGRLITLSKQQLVDCSVLNHGCEGGFMPRAFVDLIRGGGVVSESNYPYVAREQNCRFDKSLVEVVLKDFRYIRSEDEDALGEAVASVGPISVAVDSNHTSFQFYDKGIYEEPSCATRNLNHALLVVGYDTDRNGVDYWIVKNSWGSQWGEDGFIKIARNKNMCGIASAASFPVV